MAKPSIGNFDLRGNTKRLVWTDDGYKKWAVGTRPIPDKEPEDKLPLMNPKDNIF